MDFPRLDLLIYAHDGRGLGHASRSVAVGMAFRRLYPQMKVLFVSGCKASAALIGNAPLDWIKLPAYETAVNAGKSKGRIGSANISDALLGDMRAEMIKDIVALYRPRCILVDHMPQGKHRELCPALAASRTTDSRWVLGMRAVVGTVAGVWSDLAQSIFRDHYHAMLWYGDRRVTGNTALESLQSHYGTEPVAVGYVSRMAEIAHSEAISPPCGGKLAATVSLPWMGENTINILPHFARAIADIGPDYGDWRIFIGTKGNPQAKRRIEDLFRALPFCSIAEPGERYIPSLLNSKMAVIYGGYNSLTDVLFAALPAVVLLRGMQDQEQEAHLRGLRDIQKASLVVLAENEVDTAGLGRVLKAQLVAEQASGHRLNLSGAAGAARYLAGVIQEGLRG